MTDFLLSILLFFPLALGLLILLIPSEWESVIRRLSVGGMLVEFFLSLFLLEGDFSTPSFQFVEQVPWISSLGISYKLGIDGVSIWLVLLSTLMAPIALFVSWSSVKTKLKQYAFSFLLLETGMLGAFFSLDLFLFYIFWELMLVPMYLIIGIWGGQDRIYAALKFFLYTMAGSLLMLVAMLYVAYQYKEVSGNYSFDIQQLQLLAIPVQAQRWLFGAFALAFAIKVPMFPVHTWLPNAHVQAPTGGSVILAAVLLKLGTYGFIRFAMPLFPEASISMATWLLAPLCIVGIIYGAYCAWVQKDVKKLVAYSSVSHMGFVMLGLFALTQHGVAGSILQMLNHGVSTGALFILVGMIYDRRHTRDLDQFGGLAKPMPMYAVLFIIVTMSSIGLPGTNGFVGEFMIMAGAFSPISAFHSWAPLFTMLAATGVIFAAVYMLHAVLKMFWGPVTHQENAELQDVTKREGAILAPLLILIFVVGLFPNLFLKTMEPSVNQFVHFVKVKQNLLPTGSSPKLLKESQVNFGSRDSSTPSVAQLQGGSHE